MDERVRLRYRAEYAALRGLMGVLGLLPYRAALAWIWPLAWIAHFVLRFRTAEARRRVRAVVGPSVPERQVRSAAWISWRNTCFNAVEVARIPRLTRAWFDRHSDAAAFARLQAAAGDGAVIALPHTGNWDLAAVAAQRFGLSTFSIARRQRNPLTDAYLNRMREATGLECLPNDTHLLRAVVRRLRAGHSLAILPDVRNRTPAYTIQFLGGPANLGGGAALFARLSGRPVVPCICRREGWTRHRLEVLPPLTVTPGADRETEVVRILQTLARLFDDFILRHPDQYFWYNVRWVLDPVSPPRETGS